MKTPVEAISAERTFDEDINGGNSGNLVFLESAFKLLRRIAATDLPPPAGVPSNPSV